ncbi:MAG TPA: alpha/beta fold hydrolase [Anaeromyxobacteraceae bacterium]
MTAPFASAAAAAAARPASAAAFDLAGGPDAALLLHGLTGTPFEMRHVAERLHRDGLRCVGPIMAGHGGGARALAGLPWQAWVEGARRELDALAGARRVFIVGCSMGALVACALAHAAPERVAGLALLAPALHLQRAGQLAALLGRLPLAGWLPAVPKVAGSDVRDLDARRENPTMSGVPLRAVAELAALSRHVDRLLPRIAAPALVVAAREDHTVRLSGAARIVQRLGGPARLMVLERSFHLVGIDVERDRCADEVATFFDGRSPGAAARTKR